MAGLPRRWVDGSRFRRPGRGIVHVLVGAVLGVLVLHPITMVVYWFEFHTRIGHVGNSPWRFAGDRLLSSFEWEMFPMSVVFACLGGAFGAVYALLDARIRSSARVISHLEREVSRDIPTLIRLGENEYVEFKASARWDANRNQVNKALGGVIARTIAALANLAGGSLLIGVSDDGEAVGIEEDYRTLKKPGRDGFAQYVMSLVRERLGTDVCRLVHILFVEVGERDICRVLVEPAEAPVYYKDGRHSRFFVRTGNGSSELDAREAVRFVAARWGRGSGFGLAGRPPEKGIRLISRRRTGHGRDPEDATPEGGGG